jgi:hypothetical protein
MRWLLKADINVAAWAGLTVDKTQDITLLKRTSKCYLMACKLTLQVGTEKKTTVVNKLVKWSTAPLWIMFSTSLFLFTYWKLQNYMKKDLIHVIPYFLRNEFQILKHTWCSFASLSAFSRHTFLAIFAVILCLAFVHLFTSCLINDKHQ